MLKHINTFRLIVYLLFTNSVLVNAALLFHFSYTKTGKSLDESVFVIALFLLVVFPAYYIGKTGWLKK